MNENFFVTVVVLVIFVSIFLGHGEHNELHKEHKMLDAFHSSSPGHVPCQ